MATRGRDAATYLQTQDPGGTHTTDIGYSPTKQRNLRASIVTVLTAKLPRHTFGACCCPYFRIQQDMNLAGPNDIAAGTARCR